MSGRYQLPKEGLNEPTPDEDPEAGRRRATEDESDVEGHVFGSHRSPSTGGEATPEPDERPE
jgi:hypothetical protein